MLEIYHINGSRFRNRNGKIVEMLLRSIPPGDANFSLSDELAVILISNNPGIDFTEKSLRKRNIPYTKKVVQTRKWLNYNKIKYLLEAIKVIKQPYILYLDSNDVVVRSDLSESFNYFKESGLDLFANAEAAFFPNFGPSLKSPVQEIFNNSKMGVLKQFEYDTYNSLAWRGDNGKGYCYLNSGVFYAKRVELYAYLGEMLKWGQIYKSSDQGIYHLLHHKYYPKIKVDAECTFFQAIAGDATLRFWHPSSIKNIAEIMETANQAVERAKVLAAEVKEAKIAAAKEVKETKNAEVQIAGKTDACVVGGGGGEDVVIQAKPKHKYRVLIHQNTVCHFEILFSMVYFFDKAGAEVLVLDTQHLNQMRRDLLHQMCPKMYKITSSFPSNDLTIIITHYPHRRVPILKNTRKIMLISHSFSSHFKDSHLFKTGFYSLCFLSPMGDKVARNHKFPSQGILPCYFGNRDTNRSRDRDRNLFLIQGNLQFCRRNYQCLFDIIEKYPDRNYKFVIVGRKHKESEKLIDRMKKSDKFELHISPSDRDFFDVVSRCDYVMPIIDQTFKHSYFDDKLSSSITVALGFSLPLICHQKLIECYSLEGAIGYNSPVELVNKFGNIIDTSVQKYDEYVEAIKNTFMQHEQKNIQHIRSLMKTKPPKILPPRLKYTVSKVAPSNTNKYPQRPKTFHRR